MMDIARHGILNPDYYYFNEVICIFLAVGVSDVILLDIFNTLGMPTSSTVSMVFELLGGSTALAIVKIMHDPALSYANLINTDKALSIILGIFLSVAIAFVFGRERFSRSNIVRKAIGRSAYSVEFPLQPLCISFLLQDSENHPS